MTLRSRTRCVLKLSDEDEIKDAVNAFRDYISAQVLADEIIIVPSLDGQDCVDLEIDGLKAKARVTKELRNWWRMII